jgi:hypothetical protein
MRRLIAAGGLIAVLATAAGCGGSSHAPSVASAAVRTAATPAAQAAPDRLALTRTTGPRHATEPQAGVAAPDATASPAPPAGSATASAGDASSAAGAGGAPPGRADRGAAGKRSPRRVARPRVTFVGDSVPDAIAYDAHARAMLARGLGSLQLNLKVCRRLWTTSCPFQGVTPSTALDAVKAYGRRLGDVLIVDCGYNDDGSTYADGMRAVIAAANRAGVKGIVWVDLREQRSYYRTINTVIRSVARRTPNLVVASWNAASAGKRWFGSDGLHLNNAGAEHLASFLKPYVRLAAGNA